MSSPVFGRRLGRPPARPIDNDFPSSARIALAYLIYDLQKRGYLSTQDRVIHELNRLGRFTSSDLADVQDQGFINQVAGRLGKLPWHQVYSFCERLYSRLLSESGDFESYVSLDAARAYFTEEMTLILEEENLAFTFVDGQFRRRGRPQTQKAIDRSASVLAHPRLAIVKRHYNKALAFFHSRPTSDAANCVKEALCALEACVTACSPKPSSKDFQVSVRQLQGNKPGQIPPPIAEGLLKLHAYRGSGEGVAHAAIQGSRVTTTEAELVLSVVASYVTYLAEILPAEDEIPF